MMIFFKPSSPLLLSGQALRPPGFTQGVFERHFLDNFGDNPAEYQRYAPEAEDPLVAAQHAWELLQQPSGANLPSSARLFAPSSYAQRFAQRLADRIERVFANPELPSFVSQLQEWVKTHSELSSISLNELPQTFVNQMTEHVKQVYGSYTGWEADDQISGIKSLSAVGQVFAVLFGENGKELFDDIHVAALTVLLTERDNQSSEEAPKLLERYADLGPMGLHSKYIELRSAYGRALPGSEERVELYWQLSALDVAIAGLDKSEFNQEFLQFELLSSNIQGLSEEEKQCLFELFQEIAANENPKRVTEEIVRVMESFVSKARQHDLVKDLTQHIAYREALEMLVPIALDHGLDGASLPRVIRSRRRLRRTLPLTLDQMYTGTHECNIHDIPDDLKKTLIKTRRWDFVKEHVQRVVFMPLLKLTEQQQKQAGAHGEARAFLQDGIIFVATQISLQVQEQSVMERQELWRLAAVLDHEAAHLELHQRILRNPQERSRLGSVVMQERRAHAREYSFYEEYLKKNKLGGLSYLKFALRSLETRAIVHACNLFLGIPLPKLNPDLLAERDDESYEHFGGILGHQIHRATYPVRLIELLGVVELSGDAQAEQEQFKESFRQNLEEVVNEFSDKALQEKKSIERRLTQVDNEEDYKNLLRDWVALAEVSKQFPYLIEGFNRRLNLDFQWTLPDALQEFMVAEIPDQLREYLQS